MSIIFFLMYFTLNSPLPFASICRLKVKQSWGRGRGGWQYLAYIPYRPLVLQVQD